MKRNYPRSIRLRWDDRRDPGIDRNRLRVPGLGEPAPRGAPRFVGQVINAGAFPDRTDRVVLVHPVRIDGDETEGGPASLAVDSSRTIPVVVVGGRPPEIGDYLVVVSVGGRWVADRFGEAPLDETAEKKPDEGSD